MEPDTLTWSTSCSAHTYHKSEKNIYNSVQIVLIYAIRKWIWFSAGVHIRVIGIASTRSLYQAHFKLHKNKSRFEMQLQKQLEAFSNIYPPTVDFVILLNMQQF